MASDLVISRDYITRGMRARAEDLVTTELGPKSDLEIQSALESDVMAERWTRLDRAIARQADEDRLDRSSPVAGWPDRSRNPPTDDWPPAAAGTMGACHA